METVPSAMDWTVASSCRPAEYFYAHFEVRPHDAAVAARFRREFGRLKRELTPSPERRLAGCRTDYRREWQKLYESGDKDAVALDQLIAPFTKHEQTHLRVAYGSLERIDGLAAIVDAREWRTDPEKMKQAVEMVEIDRRRSEADAAETGRAWLNLRDSDTNLGDMGYWAGQL